MASSLETNKILAAILTAGIFASGAGVVSRIIYHPTMPAEPSYIIEVAAEDGEGVGDDDAGGDAVPFATLLASADIAGGESGAKKCSACHTFDDGGADKIGPNLYDIVGRDIASVSGFAYSDALIGIDGDWSYEALDAFLANPKEFAPGTKMAYAGMRSADDRADLIVYLRSLAAEPLPLPEAEAEETAALEGSEGGESESETDVADAESTAEEATEETAEVAAAATDAAADEVETMAEEAVGSAEEVADAASDVVEDAQEAAAETAEAAADAASEAVEETGDAVAAAAEAVDQAANTAQTVSDAADATVDAAAGGLVALIAGADVSKGEKVSKKCKACHVFEEGGKNKLGPALWGIVGRDIGSHDGFNYSAALQEMEGDWSYENLDQFLAAPKTWAPGTKMVFAGVKKEQDRADLIAYLRSLAAEPAPLN